MRAAVVLNRLLGFAGTVVESVSFTRDEVLVKARLRSKVLVCPCGRQSMAGYDSSRRQWRHVDFGRWKVIIEARIRRVDCHGCGQVRSEWMPWARPGARHTRDFEDMAGWLSKRMAKSSVATLLRTSWQTVDGIVKRLVDTHLDTDRLDGIYRIGVDEICYRKGRKFLTIVTDHDTHRVIWIAEGRTSAALSDFYDILGPQRRAAIRTVSMDMSRIYREPTRAHLPKAAICFDPFHVIKWAGDALETVRQTLPPIPRLTIPGMDPTTAWRKVRAIVRAASENLKPTDKTILRQIRTSQPRLFTAWQLKEQLRDLYRTVKPHRARNYLQRWIARAEASDINAFHTLANRIRHNLHGILNAITHQLSNSLAEGINAGIRLIQRRAHGYANLDNLIEMIYLCHGGIPTPLPTET